MAFFWPFFFSAACCLLVYMFLEARMNRLLRINLAIDNLPEAFDGSTIFFISDIHRRRVSGRLLGQLDRRPDIVVIGGDLTEKGVPMARVRDNVASLVSLGPTLFVWGNHDWEADAGQLRHLLSEYDVTILDNETRIVRRKGGTINFSGIDDVTTERDNLDQALAGREAGAPTLLFSHNPEVQKKLDARMDIAYVISGHTHSGQINLFGFTLMEKGGVKVHPFGTIIISNGYGTTKLPLRLAAKPDALLLTLRKK
ncbi:metallophosphoesterase [Sporolactobacillus sp. THM7-7]|nr:metallophosphoesterase [Sporolactobacillus sp. THM7-7]